MKAILTAAVLLGVAAGAPAWAGEGAGYPADGVAPPVTTKMTMTQGGISDPFKWSSSATPSQYSVVRGGISDPFRWSAAPMAPTPARQAASAPVKNPG